MLWLRRSIATKTARTWYSAISRRAESSTVASISATLRAINWPFSSAGCRLEPESETLRFEAIVGVPGSSERAPGSHRRRTRRLVPSIGFVHALGVNSEGPDAIQPAARTRHSNRNAVPQPVGAECETLRQGAGSPVQPLPWHRDERH